MLCHRRTPLVVGISLTASRGQKHKPVLEPSLVTCSPRQSRCPPRWRHERCSYLTARETPTVLSLVRFEEGARRSASDTIGKAPGTLCYAPRLAARTERSSVGPDGPASGRRWKARTNRRREGRSRAATAGAR